MISWFARSRRVFVGMLLASLSVSLADLWTSDWLGLRGGADADLLRLIRGCDRGILCYLNV